MRPFRMLALLAFVFAAAVPAFAQSSTTLPSCSAGDPVVWVNTASKVYHMKGDRYYGNTKAGNYQCKSDADKAGNRQAMVSPVGSKSPSATRPAGAGPSPAATHHSFFGFGSHATAKPASPAPAGKLASPAPSPHASHKPRHHKPKASPAPSAPPT